MGSIPGQGTKIPQAVWHSQEKTKKKPKNPSAAQKPKSYGEAVSVSSGQQSEWSSQTKDSIIYQHARKPFWMFQPKRVPRWNSPSSQHTENSYPACYRTEVWLLTAQKPIIQEASVRRKESCFNQKSQQSGEKVDLGPETNSEDCAQLWQFLKGKIGGRISVNHPGRMLGSASFSIVCRLAGSLFRGYLAYMIWLQDC